MQRILMNWEIPPEAAKAIPGLIASIVALRWISGTPLQRIGAVIGGTSGSFYLADWLAALTGWQSSVTSWLFGLFGMAIAHKLFNFISEIDIVRRVDHVLTKWGF